MKKIEMWCRGYKVEKIVDGNEVIHISEELFDSIIKELNDSIPIEWILNHERFPTKELFKKVIEDMIDDWKLEIEKRKKENENNVY